MQRMGKWYGNTLITSYLNLHEADDALAWSQADRRLLCCPGQEARRDKTT